MYIKMPRGDYKPLRFPLKNKAGEILDIDVDEIYISCKEDTKNASELLFQKRLSDGDIIKDNKCYHFAIMPEDTEDLNYGDYKIDIEIYRKSPLLKQTIVGTLHLDEEVTHKKDEG